MVSGKGRVICLDSEFIGLLPAIRRGDYTSAHVIVTKDVTTEELFIFFDDYEDRDPDNREWLDWEDEKDGTFADGLRFISQAEAIISQNFVGFDHFAFEKVGGKDYHWNVMQALGKKNPAKKIVPTRTMDTLIMSRLLNPERKVPGQWYDLGLGSPKPHSIEAHGVRINRFKPENEDWSKLTDHMIHRCIEDVEIGLDFYYYLMREWNEQADDAIGRTKLTLLTAYRMEMQLAYEMQKQELRGFRFDMDFAYGLVNELDGHIAKILEDALPHVPKRIKKKKLSSAFWKKQEEAAKEWGFDLPPEMWEVTHGAYHVSKWKIVDAKGNYYKAITKLFPKCAGNPLDCENPQVQGPFTPLEWEQVSLGNRDIIRATLYKLGWRGVNLTDSEDEYVEEHGEFPYHYVGKLDDDSMKKWEESGADAPEWAKEILKYYVYTHRRGQILNKKDMDYYRKNKSFPKQASGKHECRGLVPRCRVAGTGEEFQYYLDKFGCDYWDKMMFEEHEEWRVPAMACHIATNTFRMRHKWVVNIPSRGLYGPQMRQLFIARAGYKIMGCDASGLELRMLSHFMNDPEYENIILTGDIHTFNQKMAGLPKRDQAKTFIYAFLYGSGIANLALSCGVPKKEMEACVEKFLDMLPALQNLQDKVQGEAKKKGYLRAVDGRWGRVRKSGRKVKVHTALNVLLQMTGSLVVKYACVLAARNIQSEGWEFRSLANVHDEFQLEIPSDEVEYITYEVPDWKEEEKLEYFDAHGRMYSAPTKISDEDGVVTVKRAYHRQGELSALAMKDAGVLLGIRTPLAGEYKIGNNWWETH